MNTKFNLFIAAAALIGLASCEKHVPATADGDDAEYVIVIDGAEGTKAAAASRSLDFADLTGNSSGTFTAILQKRNRETGYMENVSFQPDWSWSKDSEAFSGSQSSENSNEYDFAAQAVGSGNVNVSASYCGNTLASSCAEVTVADSREISWTDATTTVTGGMTYSATLNCNFAGTVTVSSDNGSFLVGESTGSLSSTAGVTFSESTGTAKTIYYKYTGSEETTVKLTATASSCGLSESMTVNVEKESDTVQGFDFYYQLELYRNNTSYINEWVDHSWAAGSDDSERYKTATYSVGDGNFQFRCKVVGTLTLASGTVDIDEDPNVCVLVNSVKLSSDYDCDYYGPYGEWGPYGFFYYSGSIFTFSIYSTNTVDYNIEVYYNDDLVSSYTCMFGV